MKKILISVVCLVMLFTMELNVCAAGVADVFSAKHYADRYADVKEAFGEDEEALYQHVITYGLDERREISPVLDLVYYRENNPDLEAAFGDDWNAYVQHWFTFGIEEGRDSGKDFDPALYLNAYPDLQEAFGNDYQAAVKHYLEYGIAEERFLGIRYPEVNNNSEEEDITGPTMETFSDGSYVIYEYDENGNIKCSTYYFAEGNYNVTEYDAAGNNIKETCYTADGVYDGHWERKYNADNELIEESFYYADGNYYISVIEDFVIKSETYYYVEGIYTITEYNENSEVISRRAFDSDGNEISEE